MDIDTTPPTAHREPRTGGMQLELPHDTMMDVDDLHPAAPEPNHTPATPHALHHPAHSPAAVPLPPVSLITNSDTPARAKVKLDQLFVEWLARKESKTWLGGLLDDARSGKPSNVLAADHANRAPKQERSLSPGPSRSPTSNQPNLSVSPQQAPGSPVSRLFSKHLPFGDADTSPRSPGSAQPNAMAPFRSGLTAPFSADFDLGRSGTASPLASEGDGSVRKAKDTGKQRTGALFAEEAKVEQTPDSKTLDKVADGIADMSPGVDQPVQENVEMKSEEEAKENAKDSPHAQTQKHIAEVCAARKDEGAMHTQQPDTKEVPVVRVAESKPTAQASQQASLSTPVSSVAPGVADSTRMQTEPLKSAAGNREGKEDPSAMMMDDGEKIVTSAIPPPTPKRSLEDATMTEASRPKRKFLPLFYFPCGRDAEKRERKERDALKEFFRAQREQKKLSGVGRNDIAELAVEVVGLPSYFASIVFTAVLGRFPSENIDSCGPEAEGQQTGEGESTGSEVAMKDVSSSDRSNEAPSAEAQADSGATNSDTTMGDVTENESPDRRTNGFHGTTQAEEANSGGMTSDPTNDASGADQDNSGSTRDFITEEQFETFYNEKCAGVSKETRLFEVLKEPGADRDFLIPSDFKPLMRALLMCHQGLAFLHATPEFQQRYSETVIERIYFGCTRQHNGRLTLHDIKRSRLLETLMVVDEEEDINRERRYFSYEHFYVLYCRFWELDANHDLQIDREDLMRYGSHSLTYRIVDRIFGGYARPLDTPENPGYMSYTDFIWFCLSEEDKTSDTAIDYWFRCIDMDGDGLITMYDMEFFYKEQLHRMQCFGHEPVQIRDILCQLLDMIKPNMNPPVIRRKDLKRCRLAGNFFNVLFNLNKFFAIEARDPLQIRQEHATPELTDWDRFAALEYLRLSAEEEGEEDESWEDVGEAANPLMAGEAPF